MDPLGRGMRILFVALAGVAAWGADAPEGQRLYNAACATCHDNLTGMRVPSRAVLNGMASANILRALESGSMRAVGEKLKADDRKTVADFLGKREAAGGLTGRAGAPRREYGIPRTFPPGMDGARVSPTPASRTPRMPGWLLRMFPSSR